MYPVEKRNPIYEEGHSWSMRPYVIHLTEEGLTMEQTRQVPSQQIRFKYRENPFGGLKECVIKSPDPNKHSQQSVATERRVKEPTAKTGSQKLVTNRRAQTNKATNVLNENQLNNPTSRQSQGTKLAMPINNVNITNEVKMLNTQNQPKPPKLPPRNKKPEVGIETINTGAETTNEQTANKMASDKMAAACQARRKSRKRLKRKTSMVQGERRISFMENVKLSKLLD
ncbi:hypothetical protein LOTGIDRAFT_176055 [Lottia gigantea]|uniref:Uncharacterized protein n=1 Tax=Lottia gigantea TaxID=225164 RepID=V3ZY30_LOTGI|nr:hypothetical protein LOTGIDRAFT_176055 [Lottia gigantea]ESO85856.1 hypothetical protein LOTGIDRAFT_176055 [Lottia gigantea]